MHIRWNGLGMGSPSVRSYVPHWLLQTPPLRQTLQNFRKFAIDWLQQRLRRLRAASGPCSCPPNPYTSDPIRSVAIRCDPATDFCPKKKGKRTKMFMHFFWSLTVLKVFRILRFSLVFAVPSLRCVNCMRTKIDEYARRRVAMGRGDCPSGSGGEELQGGGEEQDPEKKAATKCECAQKRRLRNTWKNIST